MQNKPSRWRGGPLRPRQTGQLLGPAPKAPAKQAGERWRDAGWMVFGVLCLLMLAFASALPALSEAAR